MCPGGRAVGGRLWVGWLGMLLLVGGVLGSAVQLLRLLVLVVLLCQTASEQGKVAFYLVSNYRWNELYIQNGKITGEKERRRKRRKGRRGKAIAEERECRKKKKEGEKDKKLG